MNPLKVIPVATTALILVSITVSLEATPMRLRHSSKRVLTTSPSEQPRVLVDRQGKPLPKAFWKDDNPEGTPRIEVNLAKQVAQVYFDDKLVGQSPICAGRPGHETPVGEFKVINKNETHASNLYGSWIDYEGNFKGEANAGDKAPHGLNYEAAPMPHFIRITWGGVGFHAGYIRGFPASHGCMRLPKEMAATFFKYIPKDTKVIITDPSRPTPPPKPAKKKPLAKPNSAEETAANAPIEMKTSNPENSANEVTPDSVDPAQNNSESLLETASGS